MQPLATQKAISLFGYLVTHAGREHSRESLAEMLWPERPAVNARRSLHTALWQIRSNLKENGLNPDEILDASGSHVSWVAMRDNWLDVSEFEQACAVNQPTRLEQAISLYRGPFLENLYDDWCIETRYQLELKYCWALGCLAQSYYSSGNFQSALDTAQCLLHTNRLREDAHALAMQAFYQLGDRPAAIQQYAACQSILEEQLGIGPSSETRALYEMILDETFPLRPSTNSAYRNDTAYIYRADENRRIERVILANPLAGLPRIRLEAVLFHGKTLIEKFAGIERVSFWIAAGSSAAYRCYMRIVFRDIHALQAYESHPDKAAYETEVWQPVIAEQIVTDYVSPEMIGE